VTIHPQDDVLCTQKINEHPDENREENISVVNYIFKVLSKNMTSIFQSLGDTFFNRT
jgi:hypothetical protein